jgi:hypothetical protein
MADHLIGKLWGLLGALAATVLAIALIAPAGAQAATPGAGSLGGLAAVIPAPAQAAVAAALAQVPSPPAPAPAPSPPLAGVATPPPPATAPAAALAAARLPVTSGPAQPAPMPDPAAAPPISVPTISVRPTGTRPHPPARARPDSFLGGQANAHRVSRPKEHRAGHRGRRVRARPAMTRAWSIAVAVALPAPRIQPLAHASSAHRSHVLALARDAESHGPSRHAGHPAGRSSRRSSAAAPAQPAPPVSANLPPGGAEGSAPGPGGSAAGATAAAVLAFVGICMLRALLPGLLGLGLAPARSALLVSRLERPG